MCGERHVHRVLDADPDVNPDITQHCKHIDCPTCVEREDALAAAREENKVLREMIDYTALHKRIDDLVERVADEQEARAALRQRAEQAEAALRRDALDGQAALDEANNEIVRLKTSAIRKARRGEGE